MKLQYDFILCNIDFFVERGGDLVLVGICVFGKMPELTTTQTQRVVFIYRKGCCIHTSPDAGYYYTIIFSSKKKMSLFSINMHLYKILQN
ncbi:MAG: hypothetical protein ACI9TO_000565 [Rickettsiales bacterium]|jgi:hypothetical protein